MKSLICLTLLLLATSPAVRGATFCATSSSELQAALDSAASNGQADVIRVQTGTYSAPAGGFVFNAALVVDNDITLSGGWTPFFGNPCGQQSAPGAYDTKLNGNGSSRVMSLLPSPNADVSVELLTFLGGNTESLPAGQSGAGLDVGTYLGYAGSITIERNIFMSNASGDFAGGLGAGTDGGTLLVRNNLFIANSASCSNAAAALSYDGPGTAHVINNTVAFNSVGEDCTGSSPAPTGGLTLFGSSPFLLVNNILWGNENSDLRLVGSVRLVSNDYQSLTGTPAPGSGIDYHVDPKFRFSTFTDMHLGNDSPLIDLGIVPLPSAGWQLSALDLDGITRVVGSSVDLGAYENADAIFNDGFDTGV